MNQEVTTTLDNNDSVFKPITGYPDYAVNRLGQVISYKDKEKPRILKPSDNSTGGYLTVNLFNEDGRKTIKVHRLVAEAFLPNPENKPQVNHLDGDKTNNNVSNLEYATACENNRHAIDTGLRKNCLAPKQVHQICKLLQDGLTRPKVADILNVKLHVVRDIHIGYRWPHISKVYTLA